MTQSFTPKYSQGINWRNKFTSVTPENSWGINCVILAGPMVPNSTVVLNLVDVSDLFSARGRGRGSPGRGGGSLKVSGRGGGLAEGGEGARRVSAANLGVGGVKIFFFGAKSPTKWTSVSMLRLGVVLPHLPVGKKLGPFMSSWPTWSWPKQTKSD